MEDFRYKYNHKLPQFIATMISRNNRSIDMKPDHVKNSDFFSILYSKQLREYNRPKFGIGDRVPFPSTIYPSGKVINHNLQSFEIVAIATKKPPIYAIKEEQEEDMRGKFYVKELIRIV